MDKAQRNWLIVLFSGPALILLIYLGLFVIARSIYPMSGQVIGRASVAWLIIFLISLIPVYILYYCSYKKKGTALLTWSIWLGSIGLGIALIKDIIGVIGLISTRPEGSIRDQWGSVFALTCGLLLLCRGVNLLWIITCVNLRKFNLKWGREIMQKNAVYRAAFDELMEISEEKKLYSHYASSVRKHPEIESILKHEYKKRKKELV